MAKTRRHIALFYKPRRCCPRCGARGTSFGSDMLKCGACKISWPKLREAR